MRIFGVFFGVLFTAGNATAFSPDPPPPPCSFHDQVFAVYFEDGATLSEPVAESVVQSAKRAKSIVKRCDVKSVAVHGHAGLVDPQKIRHELSLNRARTVRELLVKNGIQRSKIATYAYGSSVPSELYEADEHKRDIFNRRVDVFIEIDSK